MKFDRLYNLVIEEAYGKVHAKSVTKKKKDTYDVVLTTGRKIQVDTNDLLYIDILDYTTKEWLASTLHFGDSVWDEYIIAKKSSKKEGEAFIGDWLQRQIYDEIELEADSLRSQSASETIILNVLSDILDAKVVKVFIPGLSFRAVKNSLTVRDISDDLSMSGNQVTKSLKEVEKILSKHNGKGLTISDIGAFLKKNGASKN